MNGGRPIGLPKTGGRKKGTPNQATLTLKQKLDSIGCDPLFELGKIAMNEKISIEVRVRCHSEIAPYIYPKRKPVDASTCERPAININTNLDNSGDSTDGRDKCRPDAQVAPSSGV
jgi:hypothetical protein